MPFTGPRDAVPTRRSCFRLLAMAYRNGMLVGSDGYDNGLHHTRGLVTGAYRRENNAKKILPEKAKQKGGPI